MMKKYHSKGYLIEQLKSKTYIQIAKENNVSIDAIQYHMNKHGLTKKRISWTKEEIRLLKENYENNPNVYNLLPNRSVSSINHKASKLSLPKIVRQRIYETNHDFFKVWTSEMAYILGFFYSDGNVTKDRKEINIHLNKKDHYILKKIRKIMGSNRPIRKYGSASYLRLNSKILVRDIMSLGCIPRKSLILDFPDIEEKYLSHFIRGYFDGDGSIHFNKPNTIKIHICGTNKFLTKLQLRLNKSINIKINPLYKDRTFWVCRYYSDDARKLCFWMYKNSKGLYLERKKDRFDKHIILRKNGKL